MAEESWEFVGIVYGELQAELLRGMLEAQGIAVLLNQEGAGRSYGLNVGPLGAIQILVPSNQMQIAQQLLSDYYSGKLEEETGEEENETLIEEE